MTKHGNWKIYSFDQYQVQSCFMLSPKILTLHKIILKKGQIRQRSEPKIYQKALNFFTLPQNLHMIGNYQFLRFSDFSEELNFVYFWLERKLELFFQYSPLLFCIWKILRKLNFVVWTKIG